MSGRPPGSGGQDTRPGDWRRRRRQRRTQPRAEAPPSPAPESSKEDPPAAASPAFFRLLERPVDVVGSFSAPILIAGIIALIAGAVVAGFVESMRIYGYVDMGIGGGLILIVALIYESSVIAAFFSRTGRYGINASIMVVAFIGIIVVINFVSFQNNSRSDVTATNQFSLHSTTKQLLKELDEPVRATAFYSEDEVTDPDQLLRRTKVEETFLEFEAIRSSKFRHRFVDSTLEPEIVRGYFGSLPTPFISESIVVEGMDSGLIHVVQPLDAGYSRLEQDLFTSILVVTGQERKTIYFLDGHGERDIQTTAFGEVPDPGGFDSIRLGLEGDNYDVRTLRWDPFSETVSVPDTPAESCLPIDPRCQPGAALLVIAGPTASLPLAHAQALNLFLQGKKTDEDGNIADRREAARLIFLGEPDTPPSFADLLASWGVVLMPGYIRDEARSVPNLPHTLQLQAVGPLDLPEEVSRSLDPSILDTLLGVVSPRGESLGITRMPGAAPIIVSDDANRFSVPLAITSNSSYFIDDLARTEPVKGAGEESDPSGIYSPVWYVQAVAPLGSPALSDSVPDNRVARIVLFGDSDFITNAHVNVGSGADLFINSANYLLDDYSMVSIRPKAVAFRELKLDRNEYNFVRFSSWLFIPGLLGLMAAFVWWVRR